MKNEKMINEGKDAINEIDQAVIPTMFLINDIIIQSAYTIYNK